MGNCCGVVASEKAVKIINSRGEVKLMPAPVTAAELMLDCPGFAVAPVEGLVVTRRVGAAKADEVLVPGKAYLLVPVERVGCGVSDVQLAAVERFVCVGGKSKKMKKKAGPKRRGMSGSRVEAVNDEMDCEEVAMAAAGGCRRGRNGLPWTPVLEPIMEGC